MGPGQWTCHTPFESSCSAASNELEETIIGAAPHPVISGRRSVYIGVCSHGSRQVCTWYGECRYIFGFYTSLPSRKYIVCIWSGHYFTRYKIIWWHGTRCDRHFAPFLTRPYLSAIFSYRTDTSGVMTVHDHSPSWIFSTKSLMVEQPPLTDLMWNDPLTNQPLTVQLSSLYTRHIGVPVHWFASRGSSACHLVTSFLVMK